MRVVCCSSGCCGIKHIRDFPDSPDTRTSIPASAGHDEDQVSTGPDPYEPIVHIPERIHMPASEALAYLVNLTKDKRPSGMITVNLADVDDEDNLIADNWRDVLFSLGFKETTFLNSNSENVVSHFTLIYGDD